MGKEYTYRYNKQHKSVELCKTLPIPEQMYKDADYSITRFAEAFPEIYKTEDVIKGYRQYFINTKSELKQYTKREMPYWWN